MASSCSSCPSLRCARVKAIILTQEDVARLLTYVDRDPKHGRDGGSSQSDVRDPDKARVYDEVHRFYNYQVRKWLGEVGW